MRFAWLRQQAGQDKRVEQTAIEIIIFTVYNLVYWVPLALTIIGTIDYRTGVIAFAIVIAIRGALNGYRVNVLPVEQGQRFPLRAP